MRVAVTQSNAHPTSAGGVESPPPRRAEQVGGATQALDDVARFACLAALETALAADRPGQLGKSFTEASREVQALAAGTHRALAQLEGMLLTGGKRGG